MTMSGAKVTRRRITDRAVNRFVSDGVASHQPTTHTPESLLKPFSRRLSLGIKERQREVEAGLRKSIGRPFCSGPGFILYCGDCVEFLGRIAATSLRFDLALTSPPYNIGKEYEAAMDVTEYVEWCGQWMPKIHQVTQSQGSFWLNAGYLEVKGKGLCVPIPYLIWDRSPFYLLQEVVWRYGAGVAAKRRLSPRNEKWLFYVRDPKHYTFNLDDIRDPNVKYPNQRKNGKYRCNPNGKNPSDVWDFPKVTTGAKRSSKERTPHPAQFPLSVVERIVLASSNQCDLVCDPFAGSCSAGIAALGSGRIFVGFETKPDYCEVAAQRFENFAMSRSVFAQQGTLFQV